MKNRKLLLIVSLVLAMTMSLGGTLAYLTDTDSEVNVMTVGNVIIDLIEQQRNADGNALEDFEQGKQMIPIVGSAQGDKDEFGMPEAANYVDKIVSVKNTGVSDAWVRVLVAVPSNLENTDTTKADGPLHWNIGNRVDLNGNSANNNLTVDQSVTAWNWDDSEAAKVITIGGESYNVYAFYYKDKLAKGEQTTAAVSGFYLDSQVDYESEADEGYYTFKGEKIEGFTGNVVIPVLAQAVQASGFSTYTEAFEASFPYSELQSWFDDDYSKADAGTNEDFEGALTTDATVIEVNLTGDVVYDVAAWANDAMGGEKTKQIIINGNGHKVTFNQTNSDWNNIVTNGATLVLNNMHITNSGYNDGPWNRHDLNFACDVEMNNVTSDKAMAFKAGAKLSNVTISDENTSDTYAIWIQPKGQTVTLEGCTIDMLDCTDGRGIKIDEQYLDASEIKKVTLVVKNTTFKTEEKSAILVKSAAGADITLDNVNISGVAADNVNPVWVDEASAANAEKVTVTGGSKIIEGQK